jgi:hypothetical protein
MQALLIILGLLVVAAIAAALYWLLKRPAMTGAGPGRQPQAAVPPQKLSALAQPYRSLLGEAVSIQQEVVLRSRAAPAALGVELAELSARMNRLVLQALPLAEHGTQLSEYLLRLREDDPEYPDTVGEAARLETKLQEFLEQLKRIRGKVYAILSSAADLRVDPRLETELDDALADVADLEAALSETVRDVRLLP